MFIPFHFRRILDSMKVPGQRSSFHICDILDLNTNSETKNGATANSNTTTTFSTQTTHGTAIASRDDATNLNGSTTTIPLPYQLPSNISSAMYPELAPHYHSMFPAMTKQWLKESEAYGEFTFTSMFCFLAWNPVNIFHRNINQICACLCKSLMNGKQTSKRDASNKQIYDGSYSNSEPFVESLPTPF